MRENLADLALPCIYIPVQVTNELGNKNSSCHIVGGFHGVYSTENRYNSVMSLAVIRGTNHKDGNYDTRLWEFVRKTLIFMLFMIRYCKCFF